MRIRLLSSAIQTEFLSFFPLLSQRALKWWRIVKSKKRSFRIWNSTQRNAVFAFIRPSSSFGEKYSQRMESPSKIKRDWDKSSLVFFEKCSISSSQGVSTLIINSPSIRSHVKSLWRCAGTDWRRESSSCFWRMQAQMRRLATLQCQRPLRPISMMFYSTQWK